MDKLRNKLIFHDILCNQTTYGLIWNGTYKNKKCVVKMVKLELPWGFTTKVLANDDKPFYHSEFTNKKSMTMESFLHEAKSLKHLSYLGLSPEFYKYVICDNFPIQYGFIIMQKVDSTVKDIILYRDLTKTELDLINKFRSEMHNKYRIIHGDFKPSNLGVFLDEDRHIKSLHVFDCQKIKYVDELSTSDAKRYIKKDGKHFDLHVKKNKKERHN